jgi:hypothetical protein
LVSIDPSTCVFVPLLFEIMQLAPGCLGLFATFATAADISIVWTYAATFGAMLTRGEAIAKRQGYTHEQRPCSTGRTCQEACGAGSVQCPSTGNKQHCYYPSTRTRCCTDGTGSQLLHTCFYSLQLTRISRCLSNRLLLH